MGTPNEYTGKWWKNLMRGENCRTRFVYSGNLDMNLINRLEAYLQTREFYMDRMFDMKHAVESAGCVIKYEHKIAA